MDLVPWMVTLPTKNLKFDAIPARLRGTHTPLNSCSMLLTYPSGKLPGSYKYLLAQARSSYNITLTGNQCVARYSFLF